MNTVSELFRQLTEAGLNWAILRNYEQLPSLDLGGRRLTDLDLAVCHDELDRFRSILVRVAEDHGWDALTECDHYAQSPAVHHRHEVFRFYRVEPLEYLQVEAFHADIVCGLPLLDESQMLEDRRFDARRGLFHLAPAKENMYRMVQIAAEMRSGGSPAKLERYSTQLIAFARQWPEEFAAVLKLYFSPFAASAVRSLCRGDKSGFLRRARWARTHFVLRALLKRPVATTRYALVRRAENRLRFHVRQCGRVVKVSAESPKQRELFVQALDTLSRRRIVYEWRETREVRVNPDQYPLLEHGGILIRWTPAEEADIRVDRHADTDSVTRQMMALLVSRHRVLHGSAEAVRTAEATPA